MGGCTPTAVGQGTQDTPSHNPHSCSRVGRQELAPRRAAPTPEPLGHVAKAPVGLKGTVSCRSGCRSPENCSVDPDIARDGARLPRTPRRPRQGVHGHPRAPCKEQETSRVCHWSLNRATQSRHLRPPPTKTSWTGRWHAAGPGQAAWAGGEAPGPHWSEEGSMPFLSGGPAWGGHLYPSPGPTSPTRHRSLTSRPALLP